MAKNQIKKEKEEEEKRKKEIKEKEKAAKKSIKENPVSKAIRSVFDGTILTREKVTRSAPFLFYIALLAIVYIANTYYTEKMIMKNEKIKKEIKELRSEYITTKSEFMYKSRLSKISIKLALCGIKESLTPPKKIKNKYFRT